MQKGVGVRQNRTGLRVSAAYRVISSAPAQRVVYSYDLQPSTSRLPNMPLNRQDEQKEKSAKGKLLVNRGRFDALLSKVLKTKPVPRTSVKSTGRRGSKTPILAKP
jgi:hypothetical protein